jgi:gas vesicle protein
MKADITDRRDYGFVFGLVTGTLVGAGLAMWFAPRMASEIRQRLTDSARDLGDRASEQYRRTSARGVEAVDEVTRRGQDVRDDVADAVARGAHEVERYATAAKTDRTSDVRKHSAADRSGKTPSL